MSDSNLMQTNKKPLRFSAEFPISFHYHWAYYIALAPITFFAARFD